MYGILTVPFYLFYSKINSNLPSGFNLSFAENMVPFFDLRISGGNSR